MLHTQPQDHTRPTACSSWSPAGGLAGTEPRPLSLSPAHADGSWVGPDAGTRAPDPTAAQESCDVASKEQVLRFEIVEKEKRKKKEGLESGSAINHDTLQG